MRSYGWFLLVVLLIGGIAGCSGSNGNPVGTTSAQALGYAYKGLVTQAAVTLYALRSTGVQGQKIGEGQVDNQGFFDITVSNYTGWALAVLVGGVVTDYLGNTSSIDPRYPLMGLVRLEAGVATLYSITILSTLVVYAMQAEMSRGGVSLRRAIRNAEARIGLMFGITLGLLTLIPFDLTSGPISSTPQAHYGAVTHGFFELAANVGIPEVVLAHMLGRDILDGQLDVQYFGRPILSPTSIALPALIWTGLWPTAITNFMLSSYNLSGLLPADIPAIAALAALAVAMVQAPLILALYPRYMDIARDNVFEVYGRDLPLAANAKVTVGDQVIASANIVDLSGGGLQITVLAAVAALIDWGTKDKAHLTLEDTLSTLKSRTFLRRIDPQAVPIITHVGPTVAAAGGGTVIELEGEHLHRDSTVTVGGANGKVVDAGGNWMAFATPPLAPGTYDIVVTNPGGSTTVVGAVTVKDKNLNAGDTESQAKPRFMFAWQAGYNPDKFNRLLRILTQWNSDNTTGTATVERTTVRASVTTPVSDSLTANAYHAQIAEQETQLFDNGVDFNFFVKVARNLNVVAGLGPDAVVVGWEAPTNVTADIVKGRYYAVVQQIDYAQNKRRFLAGRAELGRDGYGSVNLRCRETDLVTGEVRVDTVWDAVQWSVDSSGLVSWTSLFNTTSLDLEVRLDGNGNIGVASGTDGDSLIFGMMVRVGFGGGAKSSFGTWVGNRIREETTVNGAPHHQTDISFTRDIISVDGAFDHSLRVDEKNTRASDATDTQFNWTISASRNLRAGVGIRYKDDAVIGSAYRKADTGIALVFSVDDDSEEFGVQVHVPTYQSKYSMRGLYNDMTWVHKFEGDGGSGESSDGRIGIYDHDPDTAPQIDGHEHGLSGTRLLEFKAGQQIDRDASRAVSVDSFSTTESDPDYYTVAGRLVILYTFNSAGDLRIRRTGYLGAKSEVLLLSSNGAGNRVAAEVAFKFVAPFALDGHSYRASKIELRYDLSNGDRSHALETFDMNFSGGSVSGSGNRTVFSEDNTTSSTAITVSGTYTARMDGMTDFNPSSGGTIVFAALPDGRSLVGVNTDQLGRQMLIFATEVGTGMPEIGNFAGLRVVLSHDDFTVFPPKASAGSGTHTDAFLSPSAISLTGAVGFRTNASFDRIIFQLFQTSSIEFDNDRNVTYTEGSATKTGTASERENVVTESDSAARLFAVQMRVLF